MIEIEQQLWDAFRAGDPAAREELVERHLPLVKITIGRMAMNLPSFIDYEELYSTGCLGLLSALERYDPERRAKFSTYAITRIRGAVIDELRSHDALGRITRERVGRIRQIEEEIRREGGEPSPRETARRAGISESEYRDAILSERASRLVSLHEPVEGSETDQPLSDLLESKGLSGRETLDFEDEEILAYVIGQLDERERTLVSLYYEEELTLKEIGLVLGISESRVSQLHTEMVERIRKKLKKIGV
jgi:RNA polymerase sigma factor FliA